MNATTTAAAMKTCNDAIDAARAKYVATTAELTAARKALREAFDAAADAHHAAAYAAFGKGAMSKAAAVLVADAEMDEARAAYSVENAKLYEAAKPARAALDAEIAAAYEAFDAAMAA